MRRLAPLLLFLFAACVAPQVPPDAVQMANATSVLAAPANLFEIRLPAGDTGSINVGWWKNGATLNYDPQTWLSQGFDGVRFVGAGVDVTHIRCTSWDGITIAVKQHNGIVEFNNCTIHAGNNQATQFGEQNLAKKLSPKFAARLIDCKVTSEQRAKWLVFGYQCDLYMKRVTLIGKQNVEHDVYFHGWSAKGALVEDCNFESAGAEGFKTRPDMTETVMVPGTSIVIRRSKFTDWRQDHSWRGGAAIVDQGDISNVLIEGCFFKGGVPTATQPPNDRSHCVEIAAESNSYGGAGHVWIRDCAFYGKSLVDWSNTIIRVARNSGTQNAAKSVMIETSGIYGPKMLVSVGQVAAGKTTVRLCNTPEIKAKLAALFSTAEEATIPTASRRIPVSEGRVW